MTGWLAAAMLASQPPSPEPVPTKLVRQEGRWTLTRAGKPYAVNGVGGTRMMDDLKAAGGTSMRTWGVGADTPADLDAAHAKGLTVMLGVWLGHRSYFDYADPAKVAEQKANVRREILKYRDHPALLVWGIGNEMDLNNDTPELWRAIEDLARMVKELDPNHPVATVVAEISPQKIAHIRELCPSLDLLGINSYGGMETLPARLKATGWTKPWLATEYGPKGTWEVEKTADGMAYEATSTEKAAFFRRYHRDSIAKDPSCVGSFALIWDAPKDAPSWYSTHLPGEIRTEQVEALQELWTGGLPANLAPRIAGGECDASGKRLAAGTAIVASVKATDPDRDRLSYRWDVRREIAQGDYGGQGGEPPPEALITEADTQTGPKVVLKAPGKPGKYRLYVRVYDGKGSGASANWPFVVR